MKQCSCLNNISGVSWIWFYLYVMTLLLSHSLSLSLSFSLTHTHMHTHPQTHTHIHIFTYRHSPHSLTHTYKHTHARAHVIAHIHITHTLSHKCKCIAVSSLSLSLNYGSLLLKGRAPRGAGCHQSPPGEQAAVSGRGQDPPLPPMGGQPPVMRKCSRDMAVAVIFPGHGSNGCILLLDHYISLNDPTKLTD